MRNEFYYYCYATSVAVLSSGSLSTTIERRSHVLKGGIAIELGEVRGLASEHTRQREKHATPPPLRYIRITRFFTILGMPPWFTITITAVPETGQQI